MLRGALPASHRRRQRRSRAANIRESPVPGIARRCTCSTLELGFRDGSPEQADFERINVLLAQVEARIKRTYLSGWLALADRLVHRVHRIDDVIAMWDIGRARDAAWTNGLAVWRLRGEPLLESQFLLTLDRMVGLASRGFLIPADSTLQKLGRFFTGGG